MWVFDGRRSRRRFVSGAVVSLLGLVFLGVPLYDIWDDITRLGWQPTSTLVENSIPLFFALALVGGGVWLARKDWAIHHVETVTKWTTLGSVGTALAFGWVVALQLWAMHELKPLVIALDGLLISTVAAFGIGVNRARTNIRQETLEREREKFAGLFTNTTDAVAAVVMDASELRTDDVNERFRRTFGTDSDRVFDDAVENADYSPEVIRDRLQEGETVESRIAREDDGTVREFLVRFIPYDVADDRTYFYVVVTDVTEQRELAREQEANRRLEALHDAESALQSASGRAEACETALDAVAEALPDARTRILLDGETVAEVGDDADELDGFDGENTSRFSLDRGGAIELAGVSLNERERTLVSLLGAHLDRALARIERERRLEEEREQLEFINRTVRHNLLNDVQVIRSRVQLLEPGADSFDDHYDVIVDHLDDMTSFVRTMQRYTQTVTGEDGHSTEPRELRPVVTDEVAKVRRSYPDATVENEGIPDVTVTADDLLGPLFENLLTNAVEHNDTESPTVTVGGEVDDGDVVVRIADDGPGVPDERKERIFERGEFGDASSGSGFGLFLVDEVVDTYGGDVDVTDNDPRGAVFRVRLPTA